MKMGFKKIMRQGGYALVVEPILNTHKGEINYASGEKESHGL